MMIAVMVHHHMNGISVKVMISARMMIAAMSHHHAVKGMISARERMSRIIHTMVRLQIGMMRDPLSARSSPVVVLRQPNVLRPHHGVWLCMSHVVGLTVHHALLNAM